MIPPVNILVAVMCFSFLSKYSTAQSTPDWKVLMASRTKMTFLNNTEFDIYNLKLTYSFRPDSFFTFTIYDCHDCFLKAKDSLTITLPEETYVYDAYSFNFVYQGTIYHRSVPGEIIIQQGENNRINIPGFYMSPKWWQRRNMMWVYAVVIILLCWSCYKYFQNLRLRTRNRMLEKSLAVEKERARISAEMHDDIGPQLLGVRLHMERLLQRETDHSLSDELNKIHQSINEVSSSVREVIWSMNIENDYLTNLISFIIQQAQNICANSIINLQVFQDEGIPDKMLPGDKRRHIFLIVKEAMHNTIKHAEATSLSIFFGYELSGLKISIVDDGGGFDKDKKNIGSMGIRSMNERIVLLGGTLNIDSSSNGTSVIIQIPLDQ